MNSGIYEIANIITGKRYVGSAVNIKRRWAEHKSFLRSNKHHSPKLQRSWNKHGESNFEFNILYECDRKQLLFCEQNWINFYGIENLYNICPVVGNVMLDRKHSEETKRKCQMAHNGYPVIQIDLNGNIIERYESINEAARQTGIGAGAISSSARKYVKCKNTMFVKSEDDIEFALQKNEEICEKKKITAVLSSKQKFSKPVYQIDKQTNQIIKQWNSIGDIERKLGICRSSIYLCALGKYKSAGGYIWKYVT